MITISISITHMIQPGFAREQVEMFPGYPATTMMVN